MDEPFYKSIDSYIQKMPDLNISSYSTANTINVEEGFIFENSEWKIYKTSERFGHSIIEEFYSEKDAFEFFYELVLYYCLKIYVKSFSENKN